METRHASDCAVHNEPAEDQAVPTIRERVALGSTVYADDASHWNTLHARYLTKQIDHSVCYSDGNACTNMAESFAPKAPA
jgi:hypothetical protein